MIAIERTVLVLLAAGRATRFGGGKLDRALGGLPLGLHAAHALAELPFLARVAIVRHAGIDFAAHGFAPVRNEDAAGDMASSVRLGAARAAMLGADAVLIALADMPCVTATHARRLFSASGGPETLVGSTDGTGASPPALFGRAHFTDLLALTGDRGAGALLRGGTLVAAPADELADIDTPGDLAAVADRNRPV